MQDLTSCERFVRRLGGEPVDRTPNFDILMTYAAHYVGASLSRCYQDYRILALANLDVQEAFDLDSVQVLSDPVAVKLQGSTNEVRSAVLDCQVKGGDRYFSAAGCEIPEGTPEENLRAQGETLSEIAP